MAHGGRSVGGFVLRADLAGMAVIILAANMVGLGLAS